jgi:hypothetical protein
MDSKKLLQIIERRHNQECELLGLVDTMAAAATSMNGQNYELLMQTRQQFKEKLHDALSGSVREMPFAY